MSRGWRPLLLVVALAGVACSADGGSTGADGASGAAEPSAETGGDAIASEVTTTTTHGPYASPEQIPGQIRSQYNLHTNDCFDTVELTVSEGVEERWTVVGCDVPHEYEVFHVDTFPAGPGEPYPGDELFDEWSQDRCYDSFEAYVGQIYELSTYRIGFIRPNEVNFTHPVARYRALTCYLAAPDGGRTAGSARGSGA